MKKIFFVLAAVAALASCAKVEAEYEQTGEIALAPVPQNITKAMIVDKGEGNKINFPTSEKFNVWAWYKQLDAGTSVATWMADNTTNQPYIPEKPFKYRNNTSWGGETPYYWPKLGSLLFAGYYPNDLETIIEDSSVEYTFDSNTNKMVFKGIPQSQVGATGQYKEDIMYFNMTETSSASGPVSVIFKHALSWITVNVKKSADSPKIVIDEIKFTKVNDKGTGTVDGSATISWETTGDSDAVTDLGKNIDLDKTATKLVEPLIIPQAMAGDLVIKYTVYSSETEKFTEVYTKALSALKTDLDTWEPAKHYIYNVEIGTSEILIDPLVKDWTNVEVPVEVNKTPANDSNIEGSGSDSDDSESGNN
jgi:hypothetical protein